MVKAWLVVGLFSITATAQAAVISYASLATFTAAAGPQAVITFDALPSGPVSTCTPVQPYTPDPCVFAQGPVTFVSTKGEAVPFPIERALLLINGSGAIQIASGPFDPNDFYADISGHAIGFDIVGPTDALTRVILTETGGAETTVDRILTGADFLGATSALGFSRVSWIALRNVEGVRSNFAVDNVSVDAAIDATPVPEPASLLLLGTGLAGLWRRRQ